MLKFALLLSAICLTGSAAFAASAEFRGRFHITSASATCVTNGDVTNPASMRFRPPNLGTNGASTRLSIAYGFVEAMNWRLASGSLVGNGYKTVTNISIGMDAPVQTKMRITKQVPAAPTATTPMITITGNINNYQEPGCNVGFAATGYLH